MSSSLFFPLHSSIASQPSPSLSPAPPPRLSSPAASPIWFSIVVASLRRFLIASLRRFLIASLRQFQFSSPLFFDFPYQGTPHRFIKEKCSTESRRTKPMPARGNKLKHAEIIRETVKDYKAN
ncbi:unnamed protein product [Cuscuta europaea]|uniref:Uncharacterized protein n=1 Tax=Cuscuta europaea TaxID=41803 RepID=A0A9P0YZ18_CUSEU|nr:unnamed protein product [Cuscuta europaea]